MRPSADSRRLQRPRGAVGVCTCVGAAAPAPGGVADTREPRTASSKAGPADAVVRQLVQGWADAARSLAQPRLHSPAREASFDSPELSRPTYIYTGMLFGGTTDDQ